MELQVLLWKQESIRNRSEGNVLLRASVNGTDSRHIECTKRKDLWEFEQSGRVQEGYKTPFLKGG